MEDQSLQVSSLPPTRERVGLIVYGSNPAIAVKTIVAAEAAGVRQIWMAQPPVLPDVLTMFAAAATRTSTVRLGTSVTPTYPRHPLVLAQEVLALYVLAPGRLRLGIGPSHRSYVPVAVTEDRHAVLAAGHQMLDFYAKILFMLTCSLMQVFH